MRRLAALALAAVGVLGPAGPAGASCLSTNKIKAHIQADVVFDGVALEGPTVPHGDQEILTSPISFRVTTYLKGEGPPVVKVDGGTPPPLEPGQPVGPFRTTLLAARPGQAWRIYGAGSPAGVLSASSCTSYRVGGEEPFERLGPTGGQIALLAVGISAGLWAIFLARYFVWRRGRRA